MPVVSAQLPTRNDCRPVGGRLFPIGHLTPTFLAPAAGRFLIDTVLTTPPGHAHHADPELAAARRKEVARALSRL